MSGLFSCCCAPFAGAEVAMHDNKNRVSLLSEIDPSLVEYLYPRFLHLLSG